VRAAPSANAYDVIDAVNALRASRGLPGYSTNSILMGTAQTQADYMAATGTVTHYGANGSRPFQRALAAGYAVAGDLSLGGWFSENIMAGSGLSAQDVVNAWMGDAPHQNTMLSPNLFDIGAGIAADGNYYYFVIDCGASNGATVSYTPSTSGGTDGIITAAATPIQAISIAIASTPDEKGNVFHEVQQGQTLWQISLAYRTTVDRIKQLNHLSSDNIFVGQKLLIARADTPTPIPPSATPTRDPSTRTPLPSLAIFTDTPTLLPPTGPILRASGQSLTVAVLAIVAGALVGAGFVAWAGRNRNR
jgi:LysM repeat protein